MKDKHRLIRNTRYTILQLSEEFDSLDSIMENILSRSTKESLALKGIPEEMEDEEKYYTSTWVGEGDSIDTLKLYLGGPSERDDEDKTEISFLRSTSLCEYPTKRKKDRRGEILLKEKRLNVEETDVIFLLLENIVYAIAITTEKYSLLRIKKLIGIENLEGDKKDYTLSSDLFH